MKKVVATILLAIIFFFVKNDQGASDVRIKFFKLSSYRMIIRFKKGTKRNIKLAFMKLYNLTPVEFDVFGFDVAERKTINIFYFGVFYIINSDLRNKRYYYRTEFNVEFAYLEDCEGFVNMGNGQKSSRFVFWQDIRANYERAHWFISKWKIKLHSLGLVLADTAPDFSHPDLKGKERRVGGKIIGYKKGEYSINGHGTAVACLAGANRNKQGVEGIMGDNSYIIPLVLHYKSPRNVFLSDIAIGLKRFSILEKQGLIKFRIVNMSFMFTTDSPIVKNAMTTLKEKLFVVAAGNVDMRSPLIAYPAKWNLPNQINVGAVDIKGEPANFSKWDTELVHIAAPGAVVPTCVNGGGYGYMSGTSLSAPIVAGAAHLLFSIKPSLSVAQVKRILFMGAIRNKNLAYKVQKERELNVFNAITILYVFNKLKKL